MPGNKLDFNDFASADFSKKILALEKSMQSLLTTFKALGKEARDVNKAIKSAGTFEEFTKNTKKATDATNRFAKSEQLMVKEIQKFRFEATSAGKALAVQREKTRLATKANRDYAKSVLGSTKATGRFFKGIAKGNIVANLFTRGMRSIGRAIGGVIRSIVEFDQAIADVGAIAQASEQEMDRFRKTALQLGGTTKFTATEVAGLQKELAKLGFTTSEILDAQAAILALASAANTDLSRAAEIAGITVNQFGLLAKDTQLVVDVMARSFTTSALDIEKFAESMKFVGPAAKATGLDIQQATVYLQLLADAGISGSMAGTSLRQIMLALSKESGTFSEKIKNAAGAGLDLAGAAEEVQKRAATALLVIAEGVDKVDAMTEALNNAAGAAQELAERQLDTLKGQVTILTSAWNRLVLTVTESESGFRVIKSILGGFSNIFNNYVDSVIALGAASEGTADDFLGFFLTELESKDYDKKVKALGEELKFVAGELNEYKQQLSEANFQLSITKRREKEVREEWERRRGVAEGFIRIYEQYLLRLRDVRIEETKNNDEVEREIGLLGELKKELSDLKKERDFATSLEDINIIDEAIRKTQAQIDKINERRDAETAAIKAAKKELDDYTKSIEKWLKAVKKGDEAGEDWMTTLFRTAGVLDHLKGQISDAADELERLSGIEPDLETDEDPSIFWGQSIEAIREYVEVAQVAFEEGTIGAEEFARIMTEAADAIKEKTIFALQTINTFGQLAGDVASNLLAGRLQNIELERRKQIESFEAQAAAGIISEEKLQQNKVRINKKATAEIVKVRRQQAIIDKAAALFSIAINTAVAAMTVTGQTGVGAVAAVPLVIALGAAQAAAVLAEPLPKFEKGIQSAPGGPAVVSEKGRELVKEKSGKMWLTPDSESVLDIPKGASVTPANITDQFLKYALIANGFEGKGSDNEITLMMEELKGIKQAIKSKPVSSSTITPAGILTAVNRGHTTIKSLKKYFK